MTVHIDENQLTRLVEEVVRRVRENGEVPASAAATLARSPERRDAPIASSPAAAHTSNGAAAVGTDPELGIFADIDSAARAAEASYQAYTGVSLERRKRFIDAMRKVVIDNAESLARQAVEETGLGRVADKIQKNLLAAHKTPGVEDLGPVAYTGDDGLTLVEPGPFGVIGAITPTTNPSETIVNNAISILAAGNSVVFNPHPSAKGVSNRTVKLLNGAIREAGGPCPLICSVARPTLDTSAELMKHPIIRLLVITGGGAVVKLGMSSGKRCVAAGPGNPPVIVDDTANITKAARCIVDGASFDNNVLCTAEKEVFVFANVADQLIAEMQAYGAYKVAGAELDRLIGTVVVHGKRGAHPNKDWVGKDAALILRQIGVSAGRDVRLIICETDFGHDLVQTEMLMPVVPIVRVRDLDEALDLSKKAEHGYRHTAHMHSESVSNMSRVAREIETTIFVKNAPSYAGLGFGGEGYCTLSIAGPTGEGLTSARTFTRQRRCTLSGGFRII